MTSNGLIIGFHDFLVQVSSPPATLSTSKAVWKALKWLEMASKMVKNAFFKAPKSLPWIYPKPYVCRLFFIWCWTEKMLNRPQKLLFFIQTSSWIKVESSGTFFFFWCLWTAGWIHNQPAVHRHHRLGHLKHQTEKSDEGNTEEKNQVPELHTLIQLIVCIKIAISGAS